MWMCSLLQFILTALFIQSMFVAFFLWLVCFIKVFVDVLVDVFGSMKFCSLDT